MSKRILLVEEDLIELNMLSQLLTCKGYEVCTLSRSDKLFNEIPKCHPDLILLDKGLKTIDSGVLSRALKAIDTVSNIPVMVISGRSYTNVNTIIGRSSAVPDIDALVNEIEHQLAA
ncbi:response regulator [Mucilaginibacter sp. Bleaf8]|uniref:response regulator n=1 Tax=Mucilaginibacter sp. Bleaf8 TaxID=2834430 RepID=UPI001BCE053D|nr:response regulator [Mucilaginibacter sp. Bleaf8]MBS7565036.1 response regulator [Mucilaginibacter sp. Bleaf8]